MKHYKVPITVWDVTFAEKKKSRFCMIAEAIKRVHPSIHHVQVDTATITFTDSATGKRLQYLTPPAAQMAIIQFDDGDNVEPFTLDLKNPIVERSQRVVTRAEGKTARMVRGKKGVNRRKSLGIRKATGEDRFFGLKRIGHFPNGHGRKE